MSGSGASTAGLSRNPERLAWIAWAVLTAGLLLSVVLYLFSQQSIRAASEQRFALRTSELNNALQSRLVSFAQSLRGVQAYIGLNDFVTPESWNRLRSTLRLEETTTGFEDLIYLRATSDENLRNLIDQERLRSGRELLLKPAGRRDFYVIVTMVAPITRKNEVALGADSWADPVRRDALERARDSGSSQITGKTQLVVDRDQGPRPAFLIYQPLFKDGALPAAVISL